MSKMKHGGLNEHQRLAEARPLTSPSANLNPPASSPASRSSPATARFFSGVEIFASHCPLLLRRRDLGQPLPVSSPASRSSPATARFFSGVEIFASHCPLLLRRRDLRQPPPASSPTSRSSPFARSIGMSKLDWAVAWLGLGARQVGGLETKNRVLGRFSTGCWANSTPVEVL